MFIVLTGDTITKAELSELREWARCVIVDVDCALLPEERGEIKPPSLLNDIKKARARCAEIHNMRSRDS